MLILAAALPTIAGAQQVEVAGRKCGPVASSLVPPVHMILDSVGALFLDLDQAVVIRVEPPTFCPAVRLDDGGTNREVVTITTNLPGPQRLKAPTIRFMVGVGGAIEVATVEASSGNSEFDDARLNLIRRRRYQPALVDGVPVSVWLREP